MLRRLAARLWGRITAERNGQGHTPLLRAAIAHAQFERIHPFVNGNGRVGRMLTVLMLKDQGVLARPLIYASLFPEG